LQTKKNKVDGGYLKNAASLHIYIARAFKLVWATSRFLTIVMALATLVVGTLPALAAYIGKIIVDTVVAVQGQPDAFAEIAPWVGLECAVVVLILVAGKILETCRTLLRAQLGQRINEQILEKAQRLSLEQIEDSEFNDMLLKARRDASTRPLSLVNRGFSLAKNALQLISFSILLWQFSPYAILLLWVAALPAFIAEVKFSGDAFRLFTWRSPHRRKQLYLETVLGREDSAKEVKIFGLSSPLMSRYRDMFKELYKEDRNLTLRRQWWGAWLGVFGTLMFYLAFAWVVYSTAIGVLTLGEMTMYLLLFKQGQTAISESLADINGMYDDNLYMSTLYDLMNLPDAESSAGVLQGAVPGAGISVEHLSFKYPGANEYAIRDISFKLSPGESLAIVGDNGAGKTTLIKLIAGLYPATKGRVLYDGTPVEDWHPDALRAELGVIFQDFMRYQFSVGENIGLGDHGAVQSEEAWAKAASSGMASPFIEQLPDRYETQLGKWFNQGRELSGGQWQKVALSRAFMRSGARLLVMDEPTAAMDADAEAEVYERVAEVLQEKMVILISHRFSTVRMAQSIIVMSEGKIIEQGSHESLVANNGRYAELFNKQARGYI